jgi:hypothetical protein
MGLAGSVKLYDAGLCRYCARKKKRFCGNGSVKSRGRSQCTRKEDAEENYEEISILVGNN